MQINVDLIYPIGSIYMTTSMVSPAVLFGGTWERIKDRFILGAGDTYSNGTTGGSTAHRHDFRIGYLHSWGDMGSDDNNGQGAYSYSQSKYAKARGTAGTMTVNANGGHTDSVKSISMILRYSEGDTQTASSMPPYYTAYIWRRTA